MLSDHNRDEVLKHYFEKCRLEFTWNIFNSKFKRSEYSEEMQQSLDTIKGFIKAEEKYLSKGVEKEKFLINIDGEEKEAKE